MQPHIIERALEISRKRRGYLDAMRKAVSAGDRDSVFELARKLTGLDNRSVDSDTHKGVSLCRQVLDHEKSHRVN